MAGRPTRKKGAYTRAEIQRRYRQRKKRTQVSPATRQKQQRRAEREQALAARTIAAAAALGHKVYGVIYADPPWRFEPYSRVTGMDRAADNHYPTMETSAIAALKVSAAPDCVLYLWATNPMLPQALEVMTAWGFSYKTNIGWPKDQIGPGYWVRERHELLLIGTRGNVPAPAPGEQPESWIEGKRGAHSEKPEFFAEMIETLYPNTPKIEMYYHPKEDPELRRAHIEKRKAAGWDLWPPVPVPL